MENKIEQEQCWSVNNEDFNYGDLGELIDSNDDLEVGQIVYIGDCSPPGDLVDAYDIIDLLRDRAYDFAGEYSETYMDSVTKEQKAELTDLIRAWIEKTDSAKFWQVTNVRQYTLTAEDLQP